jgi:hypothetical protein
MDKYSEVSQDVRSYEMGKMKPYQTEKNMRKKSI